MTTHLENPDVTRDPLAAERYVNRELSLLAFQKRVLDEARNPQLPLLERVKFLAILGSNLDEFAMVRIGGLIMQKRAGIVELSLDGLLPADQLALIRRDLVKLMLDATQLWRHELKPALAEAGIHVLDYGELNDKQRRAVDEQFSEAIYPGADAPGLRSRAPLPPHLEPEPEPGGDGAPALGRGALRPGQGARRRCRGCCPSSVRPAASARTARCPSTTGSSGSSR